MSIRALKLKLSPMSAIGPLPIDTTPANFVRIVAVSLSASANCSSSFARQCRQPFRERHIVVFDIRRANIAARRQHMVMALISSSFVALQKPGTSS